MTTQHNHSPAVDTFLSRIGRSSHSLGEQVRTDAEALDAVASDESGLPAVRPAAVVLPRSAEEVCIIAKEAAQLGVGLVPRGAGTGKAGACIPRPADVVVDLSRMNQIQQMQAQDLYAVVQPGVVTLDLDEAAGEVGLMYPPDPASLESCSLGGNVATNAGGPRAVKYGVTQRYLWGLEVVLPNGDVLRPGRRCIKGVAGYDLSSLLCGSEGTLGFITQVTLHLIPAPRGVHTAWLSFADLAAASRAAECIFAAGILPRMLEVMDETAIDAVRPKSAFHLPEGIGAGLLVETDADEDERAWNELLRLCEVAVDAGATDSLIPRSEKDREALRRARRIVSTALKERFAHKLSDDIAVPRSRMAEAIDRIGEMAAEAGIQLSAYGHLGDGNLHLNLLCDSAEQRQVAQQVRRQVLAAVVAMGGTISGEHGLGLGKRDCLPLEHSAELLAWQWRVKRLFDPAGVMNPGKVLPAEAP